MWKETGERFAAGEYKNDSGDWAAEREEKIDKELKPYAVTRRATPPTRLTTKQLAAYADKVPNRMKLILFFERFLARLLAAADRAEREKEKLCWRCNQPIETVNGDGQRVSNARLAIENEYYTSWDVVCKNCGAVLRTNVSAQEHDVLLEEIFEREEWEKTMAEHERLMQQQKKKTKAVANSADRAKHGEARHQSTSDWQKRNPERVKKSKRKWARKNRHRQFEKRLLDRVCKEFGIEQGSILHHDLSLYVPNIVRRYFGADLGRKYTVAEAKKIEARIEKDVREWILRRTRRL